MDKRYTPDWRTSLIIFCIGIALLCVFVLPGRLEQRDCDRFGKPLFEHALPAQTERITSSAVKDDDGGYTASLILNTALSAEELTDFYDDTEYPPAKKGQSVKLAASALDDVSLRALKQAGLWQKDGTYMFVYIYSH